MRAARQAESESAMALAVSPGGALHLEPSAEDDGLSPAQRARICAAFAGGAGRGILHLGAEEVETGLPPSLAFFRELGRQFLTALRGVPDLEEQRERVTLEAPRDALASLAEARPPMTGAERVDAALLERLWRAVAEAFRRELAAHRGTVQAYLQTRNTVWNLVGRVCFHLAENRQDEARPFAFLATYSTRLSRAARVQHVPLSRAVEESSARRDRSALLALLVPVHRAAERSELVKELVESGDLFHPLAWTPREAHRFLQAVPELEAAGVVVRVPDWWRARRRLGVQVTVGSKPPSGLGLEAMLDFSAKLALDGEELTAEEWRALKAAGEGLALVRGKWVEIDRDRLTAVLEHWKAVQRTAGKDGLSFLEGMRLLAGAPAGSEAGALDEPEWSHVTAGEWMTSVLAGMKDPGTLAPPGPGHTFRATLRPYQREGVSWLRFVSSLGLGACLADDMGLGKTVQILALLVARGRGQEPHLLVVPASLVANWQAEIDRFAPALRVLVAHPSAIPGRELASLPAGRLRDVDLVITTYGTLHRVPWLGERPWDLAILDEAQAIKNPGAKQTRAAKALRARSRIALTGTPVENRLSDLWSLFDFLNPGLLGSAKAFAALVKRMAARPEEPYAPLRRLVQPYVLRRLKTDRRIIADLPEKTEVKAFCSLTKAQAALYQRAVEELAEGLGRVEAGIARRGLVLSFLLRFKQICNHPSQWLGDGRYVAEDSGKLVRLGELAEAVAARQEKVLVFTQFREMTGPLAAYLAQAFGRPGLVLHGETPVRERKALVDRFQTDEAIPFFVLSLKAGGVGLNLTAASHVVHFDRWWNPAVENQATDRAFRIGQQKNVLVHKLVVRGTIEEKIDELIASKQGMADGVLAAGGEALLTEMDDRELLALVKLDIHRALAEG